jgi:MIP family channel proteins
VVDKKVRPYIAELIGTFALVFIGAGTVCASQLTFAANPPPHYVVGIALAEGFILAVTLSATMNVSGGYLNPAVTLVLWVFKRLDGSRAFWLIVAQFLGAILAGGAVRLIFGDGPYLAAHGGTPHLNNLAFGAAEDANPSIQMRFTGIGIELGLTFLLTFAIFGTILDPRAPRIAGLGAGLAMTANIIMAFTLTGAAANPARWLGPMVWELTVTPTAYQAHEIYWIGPVLGALLAGGVYTTLVLPPAEEEKLALSPPHAPGLGAAPTAVKAKK